VNGWLGPAWLVALLLALGAGRRAGAALAGLLVIAALYAVLLSLYLDNTPVGALSVAGFFARYLLPLAPCLALALPGLWRRGVGVAPVLALGAFDAVYLPLLMARSYGG